MAEKAPAAQPNVVLYHPYGAAVDLWRCKDPEILIEGPQGTGKTLAILHKINALCFKYPKARILIVRKTRSSMSESVLADFENEVLKDHPGVFPEFRNTQRRLRQEYRYPTTGAMIVVRGMDNADDIRSTNFDVGVAFEATQLTEADWEMLTGRLRAGNMPYQQGIADCNPDRPSHWLNVRASRPYVVVPELAAYLPPPRPGQTQMTRLLSRHKDNPRWYDHKTEKWTEDGAKYLSKLTGMTGAQRERFYRGRWAASEGLVYPGFDPQVHVLDFGSKEFPHKSIPAGWRRMRSIDFGFTNPFVCQWWAIDPDGRMYLYREIYKTQREVEKHAERINRLSEGERYEVTISDHAASDRATLHRAGIKTQPAIKHNMIRPGIEAVTVRLEEAKDKLPRLFVFRDARVERDDWLAEQGAPTNTLEEFDGYVYPPATSGKAAKEEPVDLHNHGMDALRYAVCHLDDVARRRFKLRGGRVGRAATAGAA